MTIYFAGSIRGGRDDAAIYARIIELLPPDRKLSGMIAGCKDITVREYRGVEELRVLLANAIPLR